MSDVITDSVFQATGVSLKQIQQRAFQILCVLVDFLEAENIRYFLVGGTLLGAVRHQGFIPWDDDIDIVVPRPDYQRLLGMIDRLPPPLDAVHPSCSADTPYPFLVVRDARSRLVINYARPFDRGIGVDVFPLDAVPKAAWRREILFGCLRFMRAVSMSKQRGYYRRRVSAVGRVAFMLLSAINACLSARLIYWLYDRIVARGDVNSSALLGNLYGLYGQREVVERNVFAGGTSVEFEGVQFRAPACPDIYLAAIYGDFRRLPPVEKQHSGHRIREAAIY